MSDKAARLSARLVDPATGDNLRTARVDIERSWLAGESPETDARLLHGHCARSGVWASRCAKRQTGGEKPRPRHGGGKSARRPGSGNRGYPCGGGRDAGPAPRAGGTACRKTSGFDGPRPDGEGGWRAELRARVVKLGAAAKPLFKARLAKDKVRAGEEIRVEISTKAKEILHMAAFSWGADGKVCSTVPAPL